MYFTFNKSKIIKIIKEEIRLFREQEDSVESGDNRAGTTYSCAKFYKAVTEASGIQEKRDATMFIQTMLVALGHSPIKEATDVENQQDMISVLADLQIADDLLDVDIIDIIDQGKRDELGIDGYCGDGTIGAVKRFQEDAKAKGFDLGNYGPDGDGVDGIVGELTFAALSQSIKDASTPAGESGFEPLEYESDELSTFGDVEPKSQNEYELEDLREVRKYFSKWGKF